MVTRQYRVRGVVQGVGFRPFIHRLAREFGIQGWVLNDTSGVLIEAHASPETHPAVPPGYHAAGAARGGDRFDRD